MGTEEAPGSQAEAARTSGCVCAAVPSHGPHHPCPVRAPVLMKGKRASKRKDTQEERKISKGQVTRAGGGGVRESYRDKVKTALGKMGQRRQAGGDTM